ncbi:MAG: type III-B CRISPR module-associated protein Cmr3 [Acidobacteriia bacterium]|nr:type III-B CRISPR module-associated protein Cmr3 [Terriglobia bacterium]
MANFLTLTPRDPVVARDGRPFGIRQGNRMRSLSWLYPSVLAGSLRTMLGKEAGGVFDPVMVDGLKQISIAGPMPLIGNELFCPRPLDSLVQEQEGRRKALAMRPADPADGEGCNLPQGLSPAMLDYDGEDFKPGNAPAFWSTARLKQWLLDPGGRNFDFPPDSPGTDSCDGFLNAAERDERIHVQMDSGKGVGCEERIFVSAGLDLTRRGSAEPWPLAVRVIADQSWRRFLDGLDSLHPLGGERRLVRWLHSDEKHAARLWDCPVEINRALAESRKVRMVIATPAIFAQGWKPGWLNDGPDGLEGSPPNSTLRLRLVSAVIERWKAISGWSLEAGRVGPKPVRRAVPAGSVYFFKIIGGAASDLSRLWLQSVCDDEQDRRDGFGLTLWGVWERTPAPKSGA